MKTLFWTSHFDVFLSNGVKNPFTTKMLSFEVLNLVTSNTTTCHGVLEDEIVTRTKRKFFWLKSITLLSFVNLLATFLSEKCEFCNLLNALATATEILHF